jgi:nucleoid-associated protein YgaU
MDQHAKKLTIYAYSDRRLQEKTAEYVIPINPEQYAQTLYVDYDRQPSLGAQGVEERFRSSSPEELRLEFVFDGTGTVYGYAQADKSVPEQIKAFRSVVYDLQGEIHQPRYLKLVWKDFTFDCMLTELRVTFTLFDTEGLPLRAKLICTFFKYIENERRVNEEAKESPDLTQTRLVQDADNLSLLTQKVYGAPDYYLEVARANNLTNIRSLRPGTTLVFPPLAKSGS